MNDITIILFLVVFLFINIVYGIRYLARQANVDYALFLELAPRFNAVPKKKLLSSVMTIPVSGTTAKVYRKKAMFRGRSRLCISLFMTVVCDTLKEKPNFNLVTNTHENCLLSVLGMKKYPVRHLRFDERYILFVQKSRLDIANMLTVEFINNALNLGFSRRHIELLKIGKYWRLRCSTKDVTLLDPLDLDEFISRGLKLITAVSASHPVFVSWSH